MQIDQRQSSNAPPFVPAIWAAGNDPNVDSPIKAARKKAQAKAKPAPKKKK